ncbi:MAG: hypothetical protein EOM72_04595 [Opitutae bacterium]|nr:hypothetical protein [Opitutae bacterium]
MIKTLGLAGLVLGLAAGAWGGAVEIEPAGPGSVRLDWEAVPEKTYQVMATPDLVTPSWTNLTPAGVSFSNVLASNTVTTGAGKQFYRIARPDLEPPEVSALVPASNAVAVATNAAVYITLEDAAGIDTQSLTLSIAGWTNMGHASPYLAWTNNTVIFTPPAALGAPGATISNSLAIADTLGHALSNYTWTFELERTPETAGEFLALTAPAGSKRTASGRLRTLPNVKPKDGSPALQIVDVTSNAVVFSYEGAPPAISNGTRLVSFDAAYPFYRAVVSNAVDAGLLRITAWTEDISLTNLLTAGSFAAVDFQPADPGLSVRGVGVEANLLHAEFGDDLGGTILYEHPNLKLWLPECSWLLTADVDVAAAIGWGGLESFDASARSELTIHIKPEALFYAAVEGGDEFPLIQPISKVFGGMIGPVPVWIEVVVELHAGYEYDASVAGNAHTVVDMGKELEFTVQLRQNQWTHGFRNPDIVLEAEPITWQLEGNAHAKVYVQPKLTVLAYSLAGLWADVVPYTELEGSFQLNPLQYDWALYFGLSSTLGIESRVWGDNWGEKPEWTLYDERWPLWSTNYPDPSSAPVFSGTFPNRTVPIGGSVTLSGWASGIPDPQYRWYFNGTRIVGATQPEYAIRQASAGHAGTYAVRAYNDVGSVQTSCTVTVTGGGSTSAPPAGMVLIPGGTNAGTDPDYGAYSLTVNSFYMDKYEVTKALWDEVYTWAIANGYSFDNAGSGKAANHPVHTVNWWDVAKWCNARSQKEGRQPVYTVNGAVYKGGQSNDVVQTSAAGYRLPTDVEWEYAARGGATGRRFPWSDSDTIQHARANYYSSSSYDYDTSPTRGYHPTYNDGIYPYTSPVGSFAANGYGLHDMAGNVWEWCFDWYPGYEGSSRVARGGSWHYYAYRCRVGSRGSGSPDYAYYFRGFRAVLPPGRP